MRLFLALLFLAFGAQAEIFNLRYDYHRSLNAQAEEIPLKVALKAIATQSLSNQTFASPTFTGVALAPTTADCSAPSYSFTGRTTTGVTTTAAGTLTLCAGGALSLILIANGSMTNVNGWSVNSSGSTIIPSAARYYFSGRANIASPSTTALTLYDSTEAATPVLQFGGTDNGISKSATGILCAGTGAVGSCAGTFRAQVIGTPNGYAIASLPTAVAGDRTFVTDQITACAAIGVAPTAGGALVCPVFYNGTAWVGG